MPSHYLKHHTVKVFLYEEMKPHCVAENTNYEKLIGMAKIKQESVERASEKEESKNTAHNSAMSKFPTFQECVDYAVANADRHGGMLKAVYVRCGGKLPQ